jgi:hypothetical protein
MKVVIQPEVMDYLEELVATLYEKEYFGFLEASRRYVVDLLSDIKTRLPLRPHKPAPPYFSRYGRHMHYAAFPKSKHTTWYAFFTKYKQNEEIVFLIRYITNSHVAAPQL